MARPEVEEGRAAMVAAVAAARTARLRIYCTKRHLDTLDHCCKSHFSRWRAKE
jgi:hypothetical protein